MARRSKGLSFYKRRKKISSALIREIFSWVFGILAAVFIAAVVNFFFGMTTGVVGVSMEPTLYNGQKIFVNRFLYVLSSPKKGDVVVFLPSGNENAHYYVKRVVATPGDHLIIRDGTLYVNGIESEWVTEYIADPGIAANDLTLENGEYFCVGDNPGNSEDSRSANIGPVKDSDIIGKAWFRTKCKEKGMGFVK
ncbi:MAG: signal peptidase I [Lachnospiraceae bacterium]|nr:signal peptidase I [Lachnospiraceae bacterium]